MFVNTLVKMTACETNIYIYHYIFTIHLIMTEARSKRRVLPLIFIVKSFKKPSLTEKPENIVYNIIIK